jgi:hypothetical protein
MLAEEECALGGHETRNIVCCAKHHLEVPCSTCADAKKTKEAVATTVKKDSEDA